MHAAGVPIVRRLAGPTSNQFAREVTALVVIVAGMFAMSRLFGSTGWTWLLYLPVGFVAGVVVGRNRVPWLPFVAVAIYHALATAIDLPRDTKPFWYIGAVADAAVLTVAYLVGTFVEWTPRPAVATRAGWVGIGRRGRWAAIGALAIGAIASIGYAGVVVAIGPPMFVTPSDKATDCRTPAFAFGWPYEAINYDIALDAQLTSAATYEAGHPVAWTCSGTSAAAGSDVVTSDGIALAGWYVPAARAIGPSGPTLVLVHGWKDNKSGMLGFAAPLHADYNLVLFDLRNGGQSGGNATTMGLNEQRDVVAMLDWLDRTKHPGWIGIVGNSMGAATAVSVAETDARIRALILDSVHADVVTSFSNAMQEDFGFPGGPAAWVLAQAVSLKVGGDITATDPVRHIGRLGDRPVLLTASVDDQVDTPSEATERNFHAALDAGVPVEVAYCRGARHGQVISQCAAEWGSWATAFLDRAVNR